MNLYVAMIAYAAVCVALPLSRGNRHLTWLMAALLVGWIAWMILDDFYSGDLK